MASGARLSVGCGDMCIAANYGHLEVLQWAREHHCPWDEQTRQLAEHEGHLELLQWAVEQGAP